MVNSMVKERMFLIPQNPFILVVQLTLSGVIHLANFRRRKRRSQVKCSMCTDARKVGNSDSLSGTGRKPSVQVNKIKQKLSEKEQTDER